MRAESAVVRDTPIARMRYSAGMVSPTRRLRNVMSDGRTSPINAARMNTGTGEARPARNRPISMSATAT